MLLTPTQRTSFEAKQRTIYNVVDAFHCFCARCCRLVRSHSDVHAARHRYTLASIGACIGLSPTCRDMPPGKPPVLLPLTCEPDDAEGDMVTG